MCHFIPTHRRHSSLCGGFYVSSCSCTTDTWNKIKPLQAKVLISWTQWKTGSMGIKQVENLKGNTEQISFFPILKVLFIAVGVTMSFLFCRICKINVEGPVGSKVDFWVPFTKRQILKLCDGSRSDLQPQKSVMKTNLFLLQYHGGWYYFASMNQSDQETWIYLSCRLVSLKSALMIYLTRCVALSFLQGSKITCRCDRLTLTLHRFNIWFNKVKTRGDINVLKLFIVDCKHSPTTL